MKKTVSAFVAILACGQVLAAESPPSQSLTYVDLINRLTDLEYIATLPDRGDQCAQWSSYDRQSKIDPTSGKGINWNANNDGDGYIRKEDEQFVLAEMKGPGCIWRMWSATPKEGHVRIYLDGALEPTVDLPFVGYFDGQNAPFNRPALVHTVARGWNNYTPIPYQKSCKIVADANWGQYYHFNYETFPKGTKVPTFKRELTAAESAALDKANEVLVSCAFNQDRPYAGQEQELKTIDIAPGKSETVFRLKGSRAITCLRAKLDLPGGAESRNVLRELAIQMKWDGENTPSVWSPLGDFFGTASTNRYRSLPMGHTSDGWWFSSWYMPFAREGQVELINDGKTPRRVSFEITHAPLSRPFNQMARFHAKWHRDFHQTTRGIDWPMLKTEGTGRFVGVMLHVWNPGGGWWGEGDERFYVDGERFPSTFGTGSEDYFGYAWCNPGLFESAYHNQTCNDGHNKGHISVNRWHITDNVPFRNSFEAYIEKYFPNSRPTLYAATAYWYLAAGGNDPYSPAPLSERIGYWGPIPPTPKKKGAIEGEKLKVLSQSGGKVGEQDMSGFGDQWSNDAHLWWTQAKPGDKLDLALPVAKAGKYKVSVSMTKATDYAIVQLSLDGEKLGGPVDLYDQEVGTTGAKLMGTQELTAGNHTLSVKIIGANANAEKSYLFGLDYLTLDPQ